MASDDKGVSGIAGRYAAALLDLADEERATESVAEDFARLKTMIDESADLRVVMKSPLVPREQKAKAINTIAETAGMSDTTWNFLGVVSRNGRLFALPGMVVAFLDELARRRGEIKAEITTARELNQTQINALTDILKQSMGTQVTLTANQNPDILGGMIVKVGSKLIDASVRNKLDRLELAMRRAQ